ncbi:MAG: hypothetical protein KAT70_07385 [Thermoplasmata archaeon]|nr:hypothetical protein [Thermoplasmata archaeon]
MTKEMDITDAVLRHARENPPSTEVVKNRERVALAIRKYTKERLGLTLTSGQERALETFASREGVLLKLSHGAMIPHLGVFRLHVKAGEICSDTDNRMVSLYLIDDQYYYNWYPEITRLGFHLSGKPPSEQKSAITIPIPKEHKTKPLLDIPPPETKIFDRLENQIMGRFGPNLDHFLKEYGKSKGDVDKNLFKDGLRREMEILRTGAEVTHNYADFCARYQIGSFRRTNPDAADKVLFLSFWDFKDLFVDRFQTLFHKSEEVSRIKNEVEAAQENPDTTTTKEHKDDAPPLWFLCDCGRRNRGQRRGEEVSFTCRCGKTTTGHFGEVRFVPDITGTQSVSGSALGLSGRIVGSSLPYTQVADRMQKEIFDSEPATRFVLKSHPVYYGVGETREGDGRASLFRALCETKASVLGAALKSPWDVNPHVHSCYLEPQT